MGSVACDPIIFFSWLSAITLLFMLCIPLFGNANKIDIVSIALFGNGFFGVAMLWITMAGAPYSLKQVHWIFYVTFFAIAPLFQYTSGVWPWGYSPSNTRILQVCLLVFIWGLIFVFASGSTDFVSQNYDSNNHEMLCRKMTFELTPIARTILPLGCVACLVVLLKVVGFENMFLRTTNKADIDSSSLALIISVCLRAFVFGALRC